MLSRNIEILDKFFLSSHKSNTFIIFQGMLKVISQTPNSAKVALWVIWPVQKHYRNLMYHHWWQATAAAQYNTFLYLSIKIFLVVFVLWGRIVGRNNEGYHKQGNFFYNSSLLSLEKNLNYEAVFKYNVYLCLFC